MNIWAKMMTALRGGVNEAGEAVVDSQALRILDQEVRDASEELKKSKESLVAIIARQKVAEENMAKLKRDIEEYEGYALKALEKGDDALAHEVAQKIADFENQLVTEQETAKAFADNAAKLKSATKVAEANIKRLKQQVDTVKATDSVQQAQKAVAERHSGSNSRMRTAMDSLERIKEKQSLNAAKMDAASELSVENHDSSLQEKLQQAGITSGEKQADDVLARLKKSKS
ncbi:PspA/IM30 family protein [Alkalimarinus sediminis]|uniref:PspA/IM30 family protein n=1 Tax=Alkalimarinus sediminis TaxID=1632866 RepID=A0A9E8HLB8_9ALTE|nr:PspA/IM30 family protein [Alkalimarinus sediminis]UZW74971.1 PspA/IM30 family protein [Alkalimarinus sediminis]